MNLAETKRLMRYLATAQEIAAAAKESSRRGTARQASVGRQLDALIADVREFLKRASPLHMAREFDAIVGERTSTTQVEAQAVAVFGWLKGATDAEAWEAGVKAQAEAYAQERIRKERRTGFSGPQS